MNSDANFHKSFCVQFSLLQQKDQCYPLNQNNWKGLRNGKTTQVVRKFFLHFLHGETRSTFNLGFEYWHI